MRPKSAFANPVVDSDLLISRASKEPALFGPCCHLLRTSGLGKVVRALDLLLLLGVKIGVTQKIL